VVILSEILVLEDFLGNIDIVYVIPRELAKFNVGFNFSLSIGIIGSVDDDAT
jgi:hypothetical protein